MRVYPALALFLLLVLGLFPAFVQHSTQAQSECLAMVTESLTALTTTCGGAEGNTACFGQAAQAVFADEPAAFAEAGDVISLAGLQSLQTQPLDVAGGEWGMAVMNVHADVPLAASERGLVYTLIGDVEVENAVPFDTALVPAPPITVASIVAANIRSAPNTDARVVGNAPPGTQLLADGVNSARDWLRVMHENNVAWISRQVVTITDGNIDSLPVIGPNTRSLMQTFYLRTGADEPECADAPPAMLVIQSPEGMTANFTVNGVDIRIASTIVLRVLPGNILQLIALDGAAYSGGVSIPEGFSMNIQLSADGRSASGFWTGQRPITEEERGFLLALENLAPDLWHYAVSIPTQAEVLALLNQIRGGGGGAGASGPAAGQASCGGFRPTSPLNGLAFGATTFYWDGAPGATHYQLNIVDGGGNVVRTVEIPAQNTSLTTDTAAGSIGEGSIFTWYVDALVDGQLACSSERVTIPRASGIQPAGGGSGGGADATPTACPWASC